MSELKLLETEVQMLNWLLGQRCPIQPRESFLSCRTQDPSSALESFENKNNTSAFATVLSTLHGVAHQTLTASLEDHHYCNFRDQGTKPQICKVAITVNKEFAMKLDVQCLLSQ